MKHLKTFTDISGNDCVRVTVADRAEISYTVGYETDVELAAYYRKREDERLGRESFEVDGELFYVYVDKSRSTPVMVMKASSGDSFFAYGDEIFSNPLSPFYAAYNMWVEAHNPPKEPQEGEIWDIETGSGDQWRCVVRDGRFVSVNPNSAPSYAIDDEHIVRKEFVL